MSFDFYNESPGDWVEGANQGHRYELRFLEEPSPEQKAKIAERYEVALAEGPAEPARAFWKWSGPFAYFLAGERWLGNPRAAFARIAELVRSLDRITPLQHAAFLGAREAKRWPPGNAPRGVDAVRGVDDALPEPAVDEGFEEARCEARDALAARRIASAFGSVEGLELLPFPDERVPHAGRDEPGDELRALFEVPDPLWITKGRPPNTYSQATDGDHPVVGSPRPVARVREGRFVRAVAYARDGERHLVEGLPRDLRALVISADGASGIVTDGESIFEIDFDAGHARSRWTATEAIHALALFGPLWALKTTSELVVVDPRGDDVAQVARMALKDRWSIWVALEERVLAVSAYGKGTRFLGFCEGKLKSLATIPKISGWVTRIDDEVVFVSGTGGGGRRCVAVRGLDALYDAWAKPIREGARKKSKPSKKTRSSKSKPSKKTRSSTSKNRKKPKPALVEVDAFPPPPKRAPLAEGDAAAVAGGYAVYTLSGAVVAAVPDPGGTPHTLQRVTWRRDGAWRHADFHQLYPDTLAGSPDDALLVVSGQPSRARGADIAIATDDGSHVAFRTGPDGKKALGPSTGFVPLHRDALVVVAKKGIERWEREGDAFVQKAAAKVGGILEVQAASDHVFVRSKNKQKLLVYDAALTKRASFTDPIHALRIVEGDAYVRTADGKAYRVTL